MQSTARALILSRPAVVATLVGAVALVIVAAALSAISAREIRRADGRVADAQQSLVLLNQVLSTMNEAETAQRGYILTNDEKYLQPYEAARPRYQNELDALRRRYSGDTGRVQQVEQLRGLCDARFAEIARTVRLRREHGIAPALNVVESDEGWRLMNEVRQRLGTLQRQELSEISAHAADASRQADLFRDLNFGLLAVAVALGSGVAIALIRRLHQLEGLIKVCAWTQRVQWEGQWITFEEYLAKRFNIHVTHGISDQAAQQMGRDIANTPVPPEV